MPVTTAGARQRNPDVRAGRRALWLLLSLPALAACAGTAPTQAVAPVVATAPVSSPPSNQLLDSRPAGLGELQRAEGRIPAKVEIAALHAVAPVTATATDLASGELIVPPDPSVVVWWAGGARLGDAEGTVTLAGHVDYNGVPGAMIQLQSLPVHSQVVVTSASGRQYRYSVASRVRVSKQSLNQLDVFRTAGPPRLVLLTCGGAFDAARRSYDDNVVVVAVPA
jgi:rhodanese-related sulfurtransferase